MSLKNSYFILCRPQLGENIGFTARALKNFNISNLRIVNPRCVWPNQKALATAVGAKNVLQSANIYNSIDGAIGDLDIIFATTSRVRKVNKKIVSITDFTKKIKKNKKIGIIFGSESSGLSNDEVNCADYLVTIPTNKKFSSLNLSHSLILFCFELFKYFSTKKFKFNSSYRSSTATKSEINKFLSFIINGLDNKGFLQPEHKRKSMVRNIHNIFHRIDLSEQEIRILLGIFTTLNGLNNKS